MRRVLALSVVAGIAAVGYMLWLRDSSIVAVRDVSVTGVSSGDGREVRAALTDAARGMTTLHVRDDELRAAAAAFPTVESVSVDARFPNGLAIEVREREPVGVLEADGRDIPVAGDGTLLPGISTSGLDLPAIEASRVDPSADRVGEKALDEVRMLGAVPDPLRPLVERASVDERGGVVELSNGIVLVFGDASELEAKWASAARILADRELGGLSYIDLRAPDRPAVGGASAPAGAL
ncbi:MAG TPA: FtsQ-type POTRA domain-containing protein [Solirubrobacterales bacterium]|nr:FtsQ-type POTRA domain-containing protein [Solirubrobacterales bacterium]